LPHKGVEIRQLKIARQQARRRRGPLEAESRIVITATEVLIGAIPCDRKAVEIKQRAFGENAMRNARRDSNDRRVLTVDVDRHAATKSAVTAHVGQPDARLPVQQDKVIPPQAVHVNAAQHTRIATDEIPLHRPWPQNPFVAVNLAQGAANIADRVDGTNRDTGNSTSGVVIVRCKRSRRLQSSVSGSIHLADIVAGENCSGDRRISEAQQADIATHSDPQHERTVSRQHASFENPRHASSSMILM
jgi:hypothetical protein